MKYQQKLEMIGKFVLSVLTKPGPDNHTDMACILYAAIDLGLLEYNEKDELVKKEL